MLYWFFTNPVSLSRWADKHAEGRKLFFKCLYLFTAFLGIAVAASGAVESALAWMPRSWVRYDEDGESEWIASSIAHVAGFIVAFFVTLKGAELATRIRRLEEESN
ncbi:hypothetical protein [Bradyrhizobium sp. TM233]|uniref:hypothetical protein n=1 Tax=Bradyrhizobium sp. TM233 TaxID=2599801 RepID=UPI0030C68264